MIEVIDGTVHFLNDGTTMDLTEQEMSSLTAYVAVLRMNRLTGANKQSLGESLGKLFKILGGGQE